MKTILIVVGGIADLPDPLTLRETPLTTATIPSLDLLAQRGVLTAIPTFYPGTEISHKNSLLSLLGYDLDRGNPSVEELMEFGLDNSAKITDFPTLRSFVIPGFSGHGVCVTTSAWVRGAAKCALLSPLDIYSPGSSDAEILESIAKLTCQAILKNEFVLVYVDTPLKASLKGDYQGKVRALESIDRHLITPVADFVWKSDLMINLAVTSDLVTPWHRRRPAEISVPLILYFNNHDSEGEPDVSFTEVNAMLNTRNFELPSDLIRFLCHFNVRDEETTDPEIPF